MTVTCGSRTSEASCFCTVASSSRGVRPSAFTSPSSGRVILPSGRMGTVRDRSGSFHTETSTTSSRLSRNSVMCFTSSSCTGAAWEQPTATAATAIKTPTPLDMLPPPASLGGRDRTPREHAPCQRPAGLAALLPSLRLQSLDQPDRQALLRPRVGLGQPQFHDGERAFPPSQTPALEQLWRTFRYV